MTATTAGRSVVDATSAKEKGMFRKVFVGVDGKPAGRDAIALARMLGEPGARLTLARVYGDAFTPGRHAGVEVEAEARADSERLLATERETAGIDADLISVCAPSVGRGLHALAETHAADLLVVGSHSRGLVGRVLVGNDTRASLNGASCAVAVAPRGYAAVAPAGFATVGVGYDFSDESEAALAVARALAARDHARISALHVVSLPTWGYMAPMPGNWGEILEEDRKAAEERIGAIDGVEATAVYGLPGEELAAFGGRVDLLVVGSRSYGPMRRLILGSTSSGLARHARCPLLVLPRTAALGKPSDADADADATPIGTAA
jgi:nucleotide-binding universal stress UspA family protein